jgi:hypothetical protein
MHAYTHMQSHQVVSHVLHDSLENLGLYVEQIDLRAVPAGAWVV